MGLKGEPATFFWSLAKSRNGKLNWGKKEVKGEEYKAIPQQYVLQCTFFPTLPPSLQASPGKSAQSQHLEKILDRRKLKSERQMKPGSTDAKGNREL